MSQIQKYLIFISTSLLLLLMNIDMTAVNLALAPIAVDLNLSIVNVQWIISAYLIGGAALVMLGGLLGDIYGNKKIFLVGAIIFTLASVGVGSAHSEWQIIFMRLCQGFGAALAWPLTIVIVRQTFSSNEGLAIGLITAVMAASMSVGPPLGGVILYYLGWRWIFYINIPLGILVIILGYIFLTPDKQQKSNAKLHLPSAILLAVGLLLFIFSLSEVTHLGITSPMIIFAFLGGIFLLGMFIFLQKVIKQPLLDLRLFSNFAISSCFIIRFLWQAIWIAFFFMLSLLLQNILGFSALHSSFYFLLTTTAFAIVSPFGGNLSGRYPARSLIFFSFILYIICFLIFLYVLTEFTEIGAIIALLFFGVGTGIGFPALLNVTLKLAPENRRGMASGILYAMLFSGGSIGAVFAGSLINVVSPYYMAAKLQSLNVNFNSMLEKKLLLASTGVDKIVTMKQFLQPQIAKSVIQMLQQSFSYAAAIIIGSFIIISLISIMFTYFIKETNHS